MRVGSDYKRSRHDIAAFHHNLVTDARACGIKIYSVLLGESLNGPVLCQVRVFFVLNIVIERKHKLPGIVNLLRANAFEFTHHGRRVVMRHDMARAD